MCHRHKLASAVSCYPASMVNLIWFANKKMLIVSAARNMETWNQASCDPKTQHLASLVW